jgi:uncharacterized protein
MNRKFIKAILTLSFLLSIFTIAYSQQNNTGNGYQEDIIKKQMKERLPSIIELKNKGIIGESSGYLAIRETRNIDNTENANTDNIDKDNNDVENLVKAENDDRREVYKAIAIGNDVPLEFVAEKRGELIADQAQIGDHIKIKGVWIKKENPAAN